MQIPQEISNSIKAIQGLMASIATGTKNPETFEEIQYKDLYESIENFYKDQKFQHKNPFKTLKQWRGYAMTQIKGYAARREYVKSLYSLEENSINSNGAISDEAASIDNMNEKEIFSDNTFEVGAAASNAFDKRKNRVLLSFILKKYHILQRRPEITTAFISGCFLILATLIGLWAKGYQPDSAKQTMEVKDSSGTRNTQAARDYIETQINVNPEGTSLLPSADDIAASGRRATPRHNEYGGDRRSYQRLLQWRDTVNDSVRKDWVITEIERIEKSYAVDVMRINIDNPLFWGYICKPHVMNCNQGYENPTDFSAQNVINHLTRDLWRERARAACILRNIKTATDKGEINKEIFYEKLIGLLGEKENSLCVSKMALETYKDLTGFSSEGVFDFEGAIKDWEKRKEDIVKINF